MPFRHFFNSSYSWVEALPDPALIYCTKGELCAGNQAIRHLFEEENLSPDSFQTMDSLCGWLKDREYPDTPREILIGRRTYLYEIRPFDDGTLVLIRVLKSHNHILRLSAALDKMPWGIITLDIGAKEPIVVYANRTTEQHIGSGEGGLLKQKAAHIFHVFGVQDDISPKYFQDHNDIYNFERVNDYASQWFRLHFIPYSRDGRYCLIVSEDTTAEKQRENLYTQSQRLEALGQLAGGVAHDFNNILSIIDGYARIGKKTAQDVPETQNCLERITQAVDRASAITSQLLTFGAHKIVKGEVNDLGQIIESQEALLRPLLDASINLMMRIETGLYLQASEDPLCQILLNLCINSRDAMPDGGELIIETGRKEDRVFLRVIDSGLGMPPEVKAKMFDPFFTTKGPGMGTGLGLSMVYGLVKDLHGEIDVLTQINAGTSITIWFPAVAVPDIQKEEKYQPLKKTLSNNSLAGTTAMIVEDEPDLLNILREMLADTGLHVFAVSNGNEALSIQHSYKGKIDFLITDVVMPEMNGVKLSALFQSVRPETKVVFMSGYPANGQMMRVPLPRKAILLPKPVKFESLVNVLQKLAGQLEEDIDAHRQLSGQWKNS